MPSSAWPTASIRLCGASSSQATPMATIVRPSAPMAKGKNAPAASAPTWAPMTSVTAAATPMRRASTSPIAMPAAEVVSWVTAPSPAPSATPRTEPRVAVATSARSPRPAPRRSPRASVSSPNSATARPPSRPRTAEPGSTAWTMRSRGLALRTPCAMRSAALPASASSGTSTMRTSSRPRTTRASRLSTVAVTERSGARPLTRTTSASPACSSAWLSATILRRSGGPLSSGAAGGTTSLVRAGQRSAAPASPTVTTQSAICRGDLSGIPVNRPRGHLELAVARRPPALRRDQLLDRGPRLAAPLELDHAGRLDSARRTERFADQREAAGPQVVRRRVEGELDVQREPHRRGGVLPGEPAVVDQAVGADRPERAELGVDLVHDALGIAAVAALRRLDRLRDPALRQESGDLRLGECDPQLPALIALARLDLQPEDGGVADQLADVGRAFPQRRVQVVVLPGAELDADVGSDRRAVDVAPVAVEVDRGDVVVRSGQPVGAGAGEAMRLQPLADGARQDRGALGRDQELSLAALSCECAIQCLPTRHCGQGLPGPQQIEPQPSSPTGPAASQESPVSQAGPWPQAHMGPTSPWMHCSPEPQQSSPHGGPCRQEPLGAQVRAAASSWPGPPSAMLTSVRSPPSSSPPHAHKSSARNRMRFIRCCLHRRASRGASRRTRGAERPMATRLRRRA